MQSGEIIEGWVRGESAEPLFFSGTPVCTPAIGTSENNGRKWAFSPLLFNDVLVQITQT